MAVDSLRLPAAATERRGPTVGAIVGLAVVVAGLRIGLQPLGDNSFLTHLATGRLIVGGHGIPRTDPYSFTAAGEPWVVQSWLASTWYGVLDAVGGLRAVQLATAAVSGLLAGLVWLLARPAGGLAARLGLVATVLVIGAGGWSERPYLYGLVFLALTLLAADGRLDPRWLVPVMWAWVNSHGSFPLGLVALGALAVGRRLDGDPAAHERRALRWATVGVVLGALNPLGPRLLVFPVELLARREQLSNIIEWQAPRFEQWGQRAFLILLVLAVGTLARRPCWRLALPLAVFAPLALVSARNIVVASLVLVPVVAAGLDGLGAVRCGARVRLGRAVAAVLVLGAVAVTVGALRAPAVALDRYPEAAVGWLAGHDLLRPEVRVVSPDVVGNYLTAVGGTRVFVDDRVDMYPVAVTRDLVTLMRARPGWDEVLDRWRADVVLWPADAPLAQLVRLGGSGWRVAYGDEEWVVALRSDGR